MGNDLHNIEKELLKKGNSLEESREESEEALKLKEEALRLTLNATGMGLWSRYKDQVSWDEEMLKIYGMEEAPRTYQDFLNCLPPEEQNRLVSVANKAFETGIYEDVEHYLTLPDGSIRWVLVRGSVIKDKEGRVIGLRGGVLDITGRKRADEEIRLLNEKLEQRVAERTEELQKSLDTLQRAQNQLVVQEKLASLGNLTAGIAHEMKNPLNLVINFAELSSEFLEELKEMFESQKDNLSEEDFEKIGSALENIIRIDQVIKKHGHRANKIINNMLMHSRNEPAELEVIQLNKLLEENLTFALYAIKAKQSLDVTVEKKLDSQILEMKVFPQDLGRVFLNIFNNAFEALTEKLMRSGFDFVPTLWVSTKNQEETVEIRIKDNGLGITKENAPQIFDHFFTTKSSSQGTGLGLSLSQDIIVKEHGGQLEFESEEGKYTEFIITLPKHGIV